MVTLCRDHVATEVPLSRSRRSRLEVKVVTGAWLRPRNFRSQHKILLSRQDFMGLCRDRVFSVVTEFGQDQRVSYRDRIFLGCDRVWPRQKGFVSRQGILCRDRV